AGAITKALFARRSRAASVIQPSLQLCDADAQGSLRDVVPITNHDLAKFFRSIDPLEPFSLFGLRRLCERRTYHTLSGENSPVIWIHRNLCRLTPQLQGQLRLNMIFAILSECETR